MVVAGLDVGNATTEVVLATERAGGLQALETGHTRTLGRKGSAESLRAARRLIERLERAANVSCDVVALCDLHPVDTVTLALQRASNGDAPVRQLNAGPGSTPAGHGVAAGVHVPLACLSDRPSDTGVAIVSVPAEEDFDLAAASIRAAIRQGWRIGGVIVAGDDAVLIHNRLGTDIPVVDEADVGDLPAGCRVALEVALPGVAIATLADPAALTSLLELPATRLADVAVVARELLGRRAVAVTTAGKTEFGGEGEQAGQLVLRARAGEGEPSLPLNDLLPRRLAALAPGDARFLMLPQVNGHTRRVLIRDAWAADLGAADHAGWLRRGLARFERTPLAVLSDTLAPRSEQICAALERPVRLVGTEAQVAAVGARTTPGAPSDAVVLDIGGGTIDVALRDSSVSAAGAGELLTATVATVLGLSRGLAERAKRGPALRVVSPYLAQQEDGGRCFLPTAAPGEAVGHLAWLDGTELTPFRVEVAPEEWRALRHALKEQVIGANVQRCLRAASATPGALLVAGGGALDREVVAMIGERLRPDGWIVARADVAGRFGPRFAVAWGAVLAATQGAVGVAA
jgi:hypothetical protein